MHISSEVIFPSANRVARITFQVPRNGRRSWLGWVDLSMRIIGRKRPRTLCYLPLWADEGGFASHVLVDLRLYRSCLESKLILKRAVAIVALSEHGDAFELGHLVHSAWHNWQQAIALVRHALSCMSSVLLCLKNLHNRWLNVVIQTP